MRAAGPALVALLGLLLAWQGYAVLGPLDDTVLPAPTRVLSAGWDDRADLGRALGPTALEVVVGFAVSVAVAFGLSVALDRWRAAHRAVMPLLVGSQTLPIIVLAPLVLIWFGYGLGPKVLLVALVTFFPMVVALLDGYASADRDTTTLLRTMGAGWWTEFRLLRLPSAMPAFFTGLRISVTYAVVAAIFAESAGSTGGMALYLRISQSGGRADLVLAGTVVVAGLTALLFAAVLALQRRVVPWYAAARRTTS